MGKYSVDLNSDLGESFGAYTIGMDADVLNFVSSANIACGFHAGDLGHPLAGLRRLGGVRCAARLRPLQQRRL